MKIIKGSLHPKAEEKTFYELSNLINDFGRGFFDKKPEEKLIWTLYKSVDKKWKKIEGNIKEGQKVPYTDKRFGQYNEIPPGEYFLVPGVTGQSYKVYVIDSESKSADSGNGIEGPDGDRGGVALHHYCPRFSVGCFTFNSGKNEQPVSDFISQIPDLKINDKKPVRFIVQPRKVVESDWNNAKYGTKKWTVI